MRTTSELRTWLRAEIDDVMDAYDNTEPQAREHIRDMIAERQDSYADITDDEAPIVLRLLTKGILT